MTSFKEITEKLLKSNSLLITYLRSIVSSQCASLTDYIVFFLLATLAGLTPFWATATGAFCGGVVNCIINYKFTFRAEGCNWRAVVVKYVLVWTGSLLLNSFGTEWFYGMTSSWTWPSSIGISPRWVLLGSRLFVSLMVSWFWNFVLQRYFVYRPLAFDKYIISLVGGKTEKSPN